MPHEDISRSVGFLLHDVSRLLRDHFDRRARDLGLTRAQWRVLVHLDPREGINQAALAEILEVESITLGRHVDRLEEAGWVERRRDPADRRAWRLYLSDRVRPTLKRMRAISSENQEMAMDGLSDDDRERLVEVLVLMKENLGANGTDRNAEGAGHEEPERNDEADGVPVTATADAVA